ncbi:MAG: cutinase [Mycobacterium sp.]|nr:cutinase [Mycobacterium sp.]MDT5179010.1 cutinase [Mycobacterium sp.]
MNVDHNNERARRNLTRAALATATLACVGVVGPQATGVASADAAPTCSNVEVVFARGTNEAPGVGVTGQAFVNALEAQLPGKTIDAYGVNYPATLSFQDAALGVVDATNRVESIAATCPNTDIVLGGYSQGAAVAGYTVTDAVPAGYALPAGITGPMPASVASHVSAVVLFGTPQAYVLGLLDRSAPPIAVGPAYTSKTLQLCDQGDPICSPGGLDRAAHSAYASDGSTDRAAQFVVDQLSTPAPTAAVAASAITPS